MDTRTLSLGFALLAGAWAAPPQFQVSTAGGTHATLQAAVDACPATGCRILLTDAEYRFSEPVSVRGKSDLAIVGARPDGKRPVLSISDEGRALAPIPNIGTREPDAVFPVLWEDATQPDTLVDTDGSRRVRPFSVKRGPAEQAAAILLKPGRTPSGTVDPSRPAGWLVSPYPDGTEIVTTSQPIELKGHLHPGLIQIDSSREVSIENLEFAGGRPIEFLLNALWLARYSQFSGLAAISSNLSFQTQVRGCQFHGWSVAVRMVDDNNGGLVSDLMDAGTVDPDYDGTPPLANPGAVGGHRIERNLAHDNHLFVDLERSWDLASSVRFNRAWNNGTSRLVVGGQNPPLMDGEWVVGGFAMLKDVVYPTHVFQGNTSWGNSLQLGWNGWRASDAQLFVDNLVVSQERYMDWKEKINQLGSNLRSNWIAGSRYSFYGTVGIVDSVVPFCASASCGALVPAWGAAAIDEHLVGKGWFGDDIGAVWSTDDAPEKIRIQDQTLGYVTRVADGWSVVLPVPAELARGAVDVSIDVAQARKINVSALEMNEVDKGGYVRLPSLVGQELVDGVNMFRFEIPAAPTDSVWRVELSARGVDGNTGRRIHSNIGNWIVRPLGKQFHAFADTTVVEPGRQVRFVVEVKDSLGNQAGVESSPVLNARGWTLDARAEGAPAASRKLASANRFEILATAPSVEGVSQVVFWSEENGRAQAVSGAAYVKVAARSTGVGSSGYGKDWRLRGISRSGSRWSVRIAGGNETRPSAAFLVDPAGRAQTVPVRRDGNVLVLEFDNGRTGTHFLKIGDRTLPVALVP